MANMNGKIASGTRFWWEGLSTATLYTFPPHCLHHDHNPVTETLSHILNGCYVYKGMYIARHDRIVDLLVKDISSYVSSSTKIYKHCCVSTAMFMRNNENNAFSDVTWLIHKMFCC